MQALAAVTIWTKLLYFLRASYSIGWLVRLVLEVISDMKAFLLIFFIALLAFADAFFTLGRNNPDGDFHLESYFNSVAYAYLTTLGDWDQEQSFSI